MNLKQMILRQQELLDTAKAEKRELTAEEQAEFDELQKSIQAIQATPAAPTTPTPESNSDDGERAAVEAERARCESINALCRDFEVSENERKAFIDGGKTLDEVRTAIIEKLQRNNAPVATGGTADASVVSDAQDKFRSAAVDALIMRSGMTLEKPAEGAKELMGISLRDLAIESLAAEGGLSGLNRRSTDEIFAMVQERQYFNPTAAFPAILDNVVKKAYVEGHKTVAVTFDQFTKKGSLKDFKTADNNYLAGPAPEFLEVPEGGELKHSTMSDEKRPTRKLKTYGRQFTLTRQAFINDDINLVTRVPAKYAASARKTINKQVYEILVNNPAVYDGINLFHSNHKNVLASGTGITQAALQKMILALQNQKDEFGESIIIRPATLVLPVGLGFEVVTVLNSPTIQTSGNTQAINPLYKYANVINVVEDPTINVLVGSNAAPWFLLGAKDDTDFIEVDYLNGQEIPNIRRMETPGTLGFIWDIYLDWGISVMDFRGAIKNPGVAISDPLS